MVDAQRGFSSNMDTIDAYSCLLWLSFTIHKHTLFSFFFFEIVQLYFSANAVHQTLYIHHYKNTTYQHTSVYILVTNTLIDRRPLDIWTKTLINLQWYWIKYVNAWPVCAHHDWNHKTLEVSLNLCWQRPHYLHTRKEDNNLKLVSAIFYQILIFSPSDSPWKTMNNVFISSKKLFSFSRHSNFCNFCSSFPHLPDSKGQMEVE